MRLRARQLSGCLLSGAVLALLSASALAEDDAAAWLIRMGDAARTANYQGDLVYRDAQMLETLRLVHRNHNGDERERLVSLSGEPREIIRNNDHLICFLPRQRRLAADNPGLRSLFPQMSEATVQKLANYYELKLIGRARVAGRICRGVGIHPRDEFRYGYQFWADEQTAVPLKVSLMSPDNERIEELVFTHIEFPAKIPDSALQPDLSRLQPQVVVPVANNGAEPKLPPSRWRLQELPEGFHLTMRDLRPLPDQRGNLEHMLLSDGLSSVSVFVARQPPPERIFQGASRLGAVNAYGRLIGDYHVAVVGEVPARTVRMIAEGVRSSEDASSRELLIPSP